jgi:enediyne polyketide synthase
MASVAIVGMACQYPDARNPNELWENVLAKRRAFGRIPPERLRLEDYLSDKRNDPDSIYSTEAALIRGYEFDRMRFRVSGSTFRSADMAHWLALDVAAQALEDAGFFNGEGLPLENTGVMLGNTLTGEFSRASQLRLRWPYVSRVLQSVLLEHGLTDEQSRPLLEEAKALYKAPFPEFGEETLAGGLSNTIAGRICNHFDLKGGGYTVDGACASSLLAVTHACSALMNRDLDVVLAGGVDLSLDPFELVGFSRLGALADGEMRVFDRHSRGFLPGEGCGFLVLMRTEDAQADGRRIYAAIRGWGVSSDGKGGITRPEVEGQLLALRRAYRRAGVDIGTVGYFEVHGTGTVVGDSTEIRSLARARKESSSPASAAVVSAIKANIGHTKAAAGVAGVIKAAQAVYEQVLPPMTAMIEPSEDLREANQSLKFLDQATSWPARTALRAGVSAMGFGGINTHLVLEGMATQRRDALTHREVEISTSAQDCELFVFDAANTEDLKSQLEGIASIAEYASRSDLVDMAAALASQISLQKVRAAIVASTPRELVGGIKELQAKLADKICCFFDPQAGIFLGSKRAVPRIGLVFPGQAAPVYRDGGAARHRFPFVQELFAGVSLPETSDAMSTALAQPAIVLNSLVALRILRRLGITASIALGHSVGELSALAWAGAIDEQALLRIATVRGRMMEELSAGPGGMVSIAAGAQQVEPLLKNTPVVIAAVNSPGQTIIAGETSALASVMKIAGQQGLRVTQLPVNYAFHSPLVAPVVPAFARHLQSENFHPLKRTVASTVTGRKLDKNADLHSLLCQQIISPVQFHEAVKTALDDGIDLWIEAGPGRLMSGLLAELCATPAVSMDTGGPSLRGVLQTAAATFTAGGEIFLRALFAGRFVRPFDLKSRPKFFVNPCEKAPLPHATFPSFKVDRQESAETGASPAPAEGSETPLLLLRRLVSECVELPASSITNESRMLSDLHLNSITVTRLVVDTARRLGLTPPPGPTQMADATVAEVAAAIEKMAPATAEAFRAQDPVRGVDSWVQPFVVERVERPLRSRPPSGAAGNWQVIGYANHSLLTSLKEAFSVPGIGSGVIICLPVPFEEQSIDLLLEGARALFQISDPCCLVLVQQESSPIGAAFARSFYLENPNIPVTVVTVPADHIEAGRWIHQEMLANDGFCEVCYESSGRRTEPVLRHLCLDALPTCEWPFQSDDVLLVTGGGKGIAAECALALAREQGTRVAVLGRTPLEQDAKLRDNLERFKAHANVSYFVTDITDAAQVRSAVKSIEQKFGKITALLHGAAVNIPSSLRSMDKSAFLDTLSPKVQGAFNLLAALDPQQLRVLITFGSVIGRTGMHGEAHYAVANEWLTHLTESWQREHPHCRCLAIEWSIWSGLGMGERLGTIEALKQNGTFPISPEAGTHLLHHLLLRELPSVSVVATSRFSSTPTLNLQQEQLPLRRFLENPRLHYPGVELVSDVQLSADKDPYLDDHILQGQRIFPAVMGLEAMAQAAMALAPNQSPTVFTNVEFRRPILVPDRGSATIRVAALARESGGIDVVIKSDSTDYQADHFRATCHFHPVPPVAQLEALPVAITQRVNGHCEQAQPLYAELLFQRGRFQRLCNYRLLRATECVVEINMQPAKGWFGGYLPQNFTLGDPGARDAMIHAIQACIPHVRLLPTGVDRIVFYPQETPGSCLVHARERSSDDNLFIYDIDVLKEDGSVLESWHGLRLQRVAELNLQRPWPVMLLGPYVDRCIKEFVPGSQASIAIESSNGDRSHLRSNQLIQQSIRQELPVHRRTDGKPYAGDSYVSAAHTDGLTMAVAGSANMGCDLERVIAHSRQLWRDMLGDDRAALADLIAKENNEDPNAAATRVWAALECLKKAGGALGIPLVLESPLRRGWVKLRAGSMIIVTLITTVANAQDPLALAVLIDNGSENAMRAKPASAKAADLEQPHSYAEGAHGA